MFAAKTEIQTGTERVLALSCLVRVICRFSVFGAVSNLLETTRA